MSNVAGLGIAAVLLALNFFFVAAEFALISARRTQLEPAARAGSRSARTTLRALEDVTLMMAGSQLGITACTLGLGAVGEPAVAHLLEPLFEAVRVPDAFVAPVSFAIALFAVVTLHVVVGEMVPKNIALAKPDRAAVLLGPPLVALVTVLKPIIWLLNRIANLSVRALRVEPKAEVSSTFTSEEVRGLVDESRQEGMIDQNSYELLSGALTFTRRTVSAVLLPVESLRAARADSTLADIEQLCAETGYSRFPVTRPAERSVDVLGYLHIKDVLDPDPDRRHQPIPGKWLRPMATLGSDSLLRDALKVMQARGSHMARVVDDHGGLLGVAALEDVLEELVGEVRDAAQQTRTDGV
ncbi:MAG TPA: hemolysin family protein [Propionibacteriaceae bacterium]|nr:hemolysin family protein [Propionibacteriaceae bacterium]